MEINYSFSSHLYIPCHSTDLVCHSYSRACHLILLWLLILFVKVGNTFTSHKRWSIKHVHVHANGVRLHLWTASTSGPIVYHSGDIWVWIAMVGWCQQGKTPDLLSGNSTSSHLVAKQEDHGEGNAEFYLQSISFILIGFFNMPKI
jgi:hypothetical protein